MEAKKQPRVPRNIISSGLVSFFNDIATDMTTPLIPIFMSTTLKAPVYIIGIIMGLGDGLSNILKVISGFASDRLKKRKLFVTIGYSLSSLSKVLMGFAYSWRMALVARVSDRVGKGIRTSARDAIITESSNTEIRSRSFGVHRAFDSGGAIVGPLIAALLIWTFAVDIRTICIITIIPSLISIVLLIVYVKDTKPIARPDNQKDRCRPCYTPAFFVFLTLTTIFNIANSSDAFLFLKAQSVGAGLIYLLLLHSLQHIFYSLTSYIAGRIGGKRGELYVLIRGYFLFAIVYLLAAYLNSFAALFIIFPLYGTVFGLTDGAAPSYISHLVAPEVVATAFGLYYTLTGTAVLIASLIAGVLWQYISPAAPFIFGAIISGCMALALYITNNRNNVHKKELL